MIPATRFERSYGSPWMAGNEYDARCHSIARREASAMRSRAFSRIFGTDTTWPEITTYAPEPRRLRCALTSTTYHCIDCGGVTCPEYACATYNPGEVAHIA